MRRLDHLYGEEYSLNITDKNGFYAVELTVPMK
jgi:sensor histidine kinase YesM